MTKPPLGLKVPRQAAANDPVLAKGRTLLVVGHGVEPAHSTRVTCPHTGSDIYGQVPTIAAVANLHDGYAAGPVILFHGKHWGYDKGFGLKHIWIRHFPQCVDTADAALQVCSFLRLCLAPKTPIHYDRHRLEPKRLLVCSSRHGRVVLEIHSQGYSIVTAIPKASALGTAIGSLS